MIAAIGLGAACGLGLLLLASGVRPRPPALSTALERLDATAGSSRAERLPLPRLGPAPTPADLALANRSLRGHAGRKLAAAAALAAIPALAAAAAMLAGVDPSPALVVTASLAMAIGGYVTPDLEVRALARARRGEFVHALSGFLDITAVLLAGGAGMESALTAAAGIGDSWPLQQLRHALDSSRLTGRTAWQALGELGRRLAIDELEQLAASLQLAGEQGARVRTTLTERARALRASQLAAAEAHARALTEQMSVPVALLAVAFMLFVGFPAIWVVVGEL